jgi:hypothetical protein
MSLEERCYVSSSRRNKARTMDIRGWASRLSTWRGSHPTAQIMRPAQGEVAVPYLIPNIL